MPFRYASEFGLQVCARMVAGESVKDLAVELSVSNPTLYKWRRQALIDAGRDPGIKSYEADRLAQARRKIADLEDELKLVTKADGSSPQGQGIEAGRDRQGTQLFDGAGQDQRLRPGRRSGETRPGTPITCRLPSHRTGPPKGSPTAAAV
jgi:transposase